MFFSFFCKIIQRDCVETKQPLGVRGWRWAVNRLFGVFEGTLAGLALLEARLLSLRFERDDAEYEMDSESHGCYYLRTDRLDLSDDEIWMAYISLTRVEYGFRCLKSSLGLRPFFHQKEDRCDSHVFITVLAYHLMRFIERKLEKADLSWQSARMILQTHCYCTIIIPTKNGIIHVLRKPGNPDEKQRSIYQLLGVDYSHLPVFRRTLNQG